MIITLIGFMGAGKSKVGRALAARLGWEHVDLDAEIERVSGRAISDIFEKDGEVAFRKLESERLAAELATSRDKVISVGGGAPCFGDNLQQMKSESWVVHLAAPFQTLMERVSRSSDRPLVRMLDDAQLGELFSARRKWYDQAHFTVDTGDLPVEEVVGQIVRVMPGTDGK